MTNVPCRRPIKSQLKSWGDGEKREPLGPYMGFANKNIPQNKNVPKNDTSVVIEQLNQYKPKASYKQRLPIPNEPVIISDYTPGDIISSLKRAQVHGRLSTLDDQIRVRLIDESRSIMVPLGKGNSNSFITLLIYS